MNGSKRYELKFVLDEVSYVEALSWLYGNVNLRTSYPARVVNTLYFDNVNYQSVMDNLSGAPDRKKIRLRWYDDLRSDEAVSPALEIKYRTGRLGYKKIYHLPEIKDKLLSMEAGKIFGAVSEILYKKENSPGVFHDHLEPTLYVDYQRQYFQDIEGLRITIDRDIAFKYVVPHNYLSELRAYSYPLSVIEFKFPVELKNYVSTLMRYSNLQPRRHSKYLVGLAAYGLVQYV